MRLFIAEKPSVAKAIVAELGCVTRGDGFITCKDGSVVTWCFGHLLEQAEPDAYLPDDVPCTTREAFLSNFPIVASCFLTPLSFLGKSFQFLE